MELGLVFFNRFCISFGFFGFWCILRHLVIFITLTLFTAFFFLLFWMFFLVLLLFFFFLFLSTYRLLLKGFLVRRVSLILLTWLWKALLLVPLMMFLSIFSLFLIFNDLLGFVIYCLLLLRVSLIFFTFFLCHRFVFGNTLISFWFWLCLRNFSWWIMEILLTPVMIHILTNKSITHLFPPGLFLSIHLSCFLVFFFLAGRVLVKILILLIVGNSLLQILNFTLKFIFPYWIRHRSSLSLTFILTFVIFITWLLISLL